MANKKSKKNIRKKILEKNIKKTRRNNYRHKHKLITRNKLGKQKSSRGTRKIQGGMIPDAIVEIICACLVTLFGLSVIVGMQLPPRYYRRTWTPDMKLISDLAIKDASVLSKNPSYDSYFLHLDHFIKLTEFSVMIGKEDLKKGYESRTDKALSKVRYNWESNHLIEKYEFDNDDYEFNNDDYKLIKQISAIVRSTHTYPIRLHKQAVPRRLQERAVRYYNAAQRTYKYAHDNYKNEVRIRKLLNYLRAEAREAALTIGATIGEPNTETDISIYTDVDPYHVINDSGSINPVEKSASDSGSINPVEKSASDSGSINPVEKSASDSGSINPVEDWWKNLWNRGIGDKSGGTESSGETSESDDKLESDDELNSGETSESDDASQSAQKMLKNHWMLLRFTHNLIWFMKWLRITSLIDNTIWLALRSCGYDKLTIDKLTKLLTNYSSYSKIDRLNQLTNIYKDMTYDPIKNEMLLQHFREILDRSRITTLEIIMQAFTFMKFTYKDKKMSFNLKSFNFKRMGNFFKKHNLTSSQAATLEKTVQDNLKIEFVNSTEDTEGTKGTEGTEGTKGTEGNLEVGLQSLDQFALNPEGK